MTGFEGGSRHSLAYSRRCNRRLGLQWSTKRAGVRAPRTRGKNHFSTICQLAAPASSDVISERITDSRADCHADHFLRVPNFVGQAANAAFIETKNIPAFSRMWFNFNAIKVIPNAWSM